MDSKEIMQSSMEYYLTELSFLEYIGFMGRIYGSQNIEKVLARCDEEGNFAEGSLSQVSGELKV